MQVDFYQLSARPVEQILPRIAEKLVEQGARLLVVAHDSALLNRLDTELWSYRPDSFLPHAIAGRDVDMDQMILLSPDIIATNKATNIALIDGIWREEALSYTRAFYMFDEATLDAARTAWRELAGQKDIERRFWKQDEAGRWTQMA